MRAFAASRPAKPLPPATGSSAAEASGRRHRASAATALGTLREAMKACPLPHLAADAAQVEADTLGEASWSGS